MKSFVTALVALVLLCGVSHAATTDLRGNEARNFSPVLRVSKLIDFAKSTVTTGTTVYLATIPSRSIVRGVSVKAIKATGVTCTLDVGDTVTTTAFLTDVDINSATNAKCSFGDSVTTASSTVGAYKYYPGGTIITGYLDGTNPKRGRVEVEVTYENY